MSGGEILLGLTALSSGQVLPVSYPGEAHALTVGKSGSGKSRKVALPNLIQMPGSAIVGDFKGELACQTALWREAILCQNVFVFDPFNIVPDIYLPRRIGSRRAGFNPIDYIRRAKSPLSAAQKVAQALIPPGGIKESTHWTEAAQNRLVATLLFVAFDPIIEYMEAEARKMGLAISDSFLRNMATVWKCLSDKAIEKLSLEMMLESNNDFIKDQASAFHKVSKGNLEIQSIRNHLRTNLTMTLSEPQIMRTLTESSVDFSTFATKPQTVYICLPGDMATVHFRYLRLLATIALSEIESAGLRAYDTTQAPTYFLLDEFATLGNFPLIVEALGRFRGYGIKFHIAVQALSQLKALYGSHFESIMANCECIQYFGGTNDVFTAEYMSKICGVGTVVNPGDSRNTKPGDGGSMSESTLARMLYTPDEIMRLPLPRQTIKIAGRNAVEANLFDPSLYDFPEYLAFMDSINAGETADWAVRRVMQTAPRQQQYAVAPTVLRQPPARPVATKQPVSAFSLFDRVIASILGHENE